MAKVTYADLENGIMAGVLHTFSKKIPILKRKALLPIVTKLEKMERRGKREKEKFLFLYGKKAPENWPNAGQLLIEAALMEEADYNEFLAAYESLQAEEYEFEWDPIEVVLKKEEAEKLNLHELRAAEIFFDIKD